jgi:hypothetical protein
VGISTVNFIVNFRGEWRNTTMKKNHVLRRTLLELIGMNVSQSQLPYFLCKQGFYYKKDRNGKKIPLSNVRIHVLLKELKKDGYCRLVMRSGINWWILTEKKYIIPKHVYGGTVTQNTFIRLHHRIFNYRCIEKSWATNLLMNEHLWGWRRRWDKINKLRNGVTQYLYYGCHDIKDVTVQRIEGKNNDIWRIVITEDIMEARDFLANDEYYEKRAEWIKTWLEHEFSCRLAFIRAFKPHYAIRPPPIPLLQREALKSTFKVNDVTLDASKDSIPELETDDRELVVKMLTVLSDRRLLEKFICSFSI